MLCLFVCFLVWAGASPASGTFADVVQSLQWQDIRVNKGLVHLWCLHMCLLRCIFCQLLMCVILKGFGQRHHNSTEQNKKEAQEVVDFLPQQWCRYTVLTVDVHQKWWEDDEAVRGLRHQRKWRHDGRAFIYGGRCKTGCTVCVCAWGMVVIYCRSACEMKTDVIWRRTSV